MNNLKFSSARHAFHNVDLRSFVLCLGRFGSLIAIFFFAIVCSGAQARESSNYTVTISLSDVPQAKVEADVQVVAGRLFMIGGSVNHLPRGWATFVREIKAADMNGNVLALEEFSDEKYKAQWRVAGSYQGTIRLTYTVDLSLAKTKWPAGNEQAAYFDGKALFAASRLLFIVSDLDGPATVKFRLPPLARVSTPWKNAAGGLYTASGQSLVNNTLVVGDYGGKRMRFGNFDFEIALLGDVTKSDALISSTLQKFARAFTKIFPDTPPSSYLITLFFADSEDGEAYDASAAFTTKPPLTSENMIVWGVTLGHELFHFWCGHQIQGENYEDSQWFQEGFTEYYANLAMNREGILPERFFIWKAENTLGKYLYFRSAPQFDKVSLKDAGQRKTTYRFGVYDGGWAAAFALDITLREKTKGKKTLDDFMRRMFQKFGLTKTKFKYEDIVSTASEIAGEDMASFFKSYVDGLEVIPVSQLLEKVGYGTSGEEYAAELFIFPKKATELKRQLLGQYAGATILIKGNK